MWNLGWQETMFIFLLALVIFGPKKLPELGKNIAKGLAEFRKHSSELKATFDREMANIEKDTSEVRQDLQKYTNEINNYDSSYENNYYDSGYDNYYSDSNSTSTQDSTVSASATQGAESSTATAGSNGESHAVTTADAATSPAPDNHAAPTETAVHAAPEAEGKPVARS